MSDILFQYHKVNPTMWVYLSSLLTIGLFFKFSRFWSVRNLDLILLILLAPGLLLVQYGQESEAVALAKVEGETNISQAEEVSSASAAEVSPVPPKPPPDPHAEPPLDPEVARAQNTQWWGYVWLLAIGALLLARLLLDPAMIRRPLLEPNLLAGGMTFIGCSLFIVLMANVITSSVTESELAKAKGKATGAESNDWHGPGYAIVMMLPRVPTMRMLSRDDAPAAVESARVISAKIMAILCHLAVVAGLVVIGFWHFDNMRMGLGAAMLYLMLPYTAQMTGLVEHVLPAALLVWAVLCYRRPLIAGLFLGVAIAAMYYPLFLLPLWASFYAPRGLLRFLIGVFTMLVVMSLALIFVSEDAPAFWILFRQMFGLMPPAMQNMDGLWRLGWEPMYRIPAIAAFLVLCVSLAIWPLQKNLGTLISCSAAVMLATQFWHGFGGGLYMGWYLPLFLLTIFRPNLENRVALAVLGESWFPRRRQLGVEKAA